MAEKIKRGDTTAMAEPRNPSGEGDRSLFRELLETFLFGIPLLLFCRGFVWANYQIPTKSMENNLLVGDHLITNTFLFRRASDWGKKLLPLRDIKRGDVVVFKYPGDGKENFIKRCVGLPGDFLEILHDRVYENGNFLNEPYAFFKKPNNGESTRDPEIGYRPRGYYDLKAGIEHAEYLNPRYPLISMTHLRRETLKSLARFKHSDPRSHADIMARFRAGDPEAIPRGFYLMLGDNRNLSDDSRGWGLVPEEFILGRAYFVWWSYGEQEGSHQFKGFKRAWSYLRVPFTLWTRTHWAESFRRIK